VLAIAYMSREKQRVRPLLMGAFMIALLTTMVVQPGLTQPALDPNSLIGEWQGEWSIPEAGTTNRVRITVNSVRDRHIEGIIYMSGPAAYHKKDLKLVDATVSNGRFIFRIRENPNLLFDFVVKGSEMTAILVGPSAPWEFHLKK
jgi:hypothetical protein